MKDTNLEKHLSRTERCLPLNHQVACVLGDWMEWSGCTRPCGGGQQTQVRAIMQEAEKSVENLKQHTSTSVGYLVFLLEMFLNLLFSICLGLINPKNLLAREAAAGGKLCQGENGRLATWFGLTVLFQTEELAAAGSSWQIKI